MRAGRLAGWPRAAVPGGELGVVRNGYETDEPVVVVEAAIVLRTRQGERALDTLADFLRAGDVVVIPFGEEHWGVAMAAFARYGKGRHPAALSYGDCLAYATAKVAGVPLLAKGDSFAPDRPRAGLNRGGHLDRAMMHVMLRSKHHAHHDHARP